jgi:ectoine hydroxylase-related dioxygenase (phytanoyl-CoA dioxygenase family)
MDILDSGYFTESAVLSGSECDTLLGTLEKSTKSGRAGTRHLMSNDVVNKLAHDERLLQIAKEALGVPGVPFRATLFAKSGDANWLIPWHQDTALPLAKHLDDPEWGSWSRKEAVLYAHAPEWALSRVVALRIHLDSSTSENGPLRVLPGSHRAGVLTDESVHDHVTNREQLTCLVERGGILAMRPLLIHSSSKSKSDQPRRVLHIEYSDSLDLKPGIRLAVA